MITAQLPKPIIYPDSDGKPMAENTIPYGLIVLFKENVEVIFAQDQNVFIAADNLIYPIEGDPKICQAPDVYVAFGRPKGDRGSYKVWEEGDIFPQVVVEVLSPSNRGNEMARKFSFYERYGAEEYYIIDPECDQLSGWLRAGDRLKEIAEMNGFVSPRLGVRFELHDDEFVFFRPDGKRFLSFTELAERVAKAEIEQKISEAAIRKAEQEISRMRAAMIANGMNPDAIP